MKKIIGVMPLWDEERNSLWMLPGYLEGIEENGGLPLIFPLTSDKEELEQLCSLCDGFLFTGGQDVSPEIYHAKAKDGMVESFRLRDDMELVVLDIALQNDKPVLGICRGIQFINAALGGTLYQDIQSEHPSRTEHHMSAPYDRVIHQVSIRKDSPLYSLLGKETLGVNSYHHQAVKTISPMLKVMAESEDGLIEAVYLPDHKYVWAFQWHPELSFKTDENSRRIFSSFIDSCK